MWGEGGFVREEEEKRGTMLLRRLSFCFLIVGYDLPFEMLDKGND